MKPLLLVNEIFSSINGEVCRQHQGSLCTFIRLQGCNLRCTYCDTKKAQDIGDENAEVMSVAEVVKEIKKQKNINITITGGEPLMQKPSLEKLLLKVVDNHHVSIETNGSIEIPFTYPWSHVKWVVDYKLPYSGECMKMLEYNFEHILNASDIVKFVVASYSDFTFALRKIDRIKKVCEENTGTHPMFAFSPCVSGEFTAFGLCNLMIRSDSLCKLGAVFSLQLHKIIGVS